VVLQYANGLMAQPTLVNGKIVRKMVKAHLSFQMEVNTRELLKVTNQMEKVRKHFLI